MAPLVGFDLTKRRDIFMEDHILLTLLAIGEDCNFDPNAAEQKSLKSFRKSIFFLIFHSYFFSFEGAGLGCI